MVTLSAAMDWEGQRLELEGKGTYLYLINATSSLDASTEDSYRATLQSTISNIYIGLNN